MKVSPRMAPGDHLSLRDRGEKLEKKAENKDLRADESRV